MTDPLCLALQVWLAGHSGAAVPLPLGASGGRAVGTHLTWVSTSPIHGT